MRGALLQTTVLHSGAVLGVFTSQKNLIYCVVNGLRYSNGKSNMFEN
jgi:hypothetical protein